MEVGCEERRDEEQGKGREGGREVARNEENKVSIRRRRQCMRACGGRKESGGKVFGGNFAAHAPHACFGPWGSIGWSPLGPRRGSHKKVSYMTGKPEK